MNTNNAYILDYNIISAFGLGVDVLWQGLKAGQSAIRPFDRFDTSSYKSPNAGFVDENILADGESHLMRMLNTLIKDIKVDIDAQLLFASTIGEIDILEKAVENDDADLMKKSTLVATAVKLQTVFKLKKDPIVVSAACASTTSAINRALSLIRSGQEDIIIIVAADIVSDFVYSGFTSLLALDDDCAKPFDESRAGLSIGESAGYLILVSDKYLKANGKEARYCISGAGQSNDANHMTGPSRDGKGLALAIERAIKCSNIESSDVDCIAAHGTGTMYNDSMELKAFKKTFNMPKPTFSVKGATGHTMGSAGLVQVVAVIKAMDEGLVPKTVGLNKVDPEAQSWVYDHSLEHELSKSLIVNAGFGGINAAVILEKI